MSRIFGAEIAGRKTLMINYGTLITYSNPACHPFGPVNFVWNELGKLHDIERFEKTHGLLKTDRQKQQYQGPECKKSKKII